MIVPEGRIEWDLRIVALSYVVAFSVCFVGSMFMVHMESHIVRQMIFSTIAALGCCSMHYTGMRHRCIQIGIHAENFASDRHGSSDLLYVHATLAHGRLPRVPAVHYRRHRRLGVRGLQRYPRSRRSDGTEPDGGDDPDEATIVANYGGEGSC